MPDMFTIVRKSPDFQDHHAGGKRVALWLGCIAARAPDKPPEKSCRRSPPFFVMFFHLLYCLMDVEYPLYSIPSDICLPFGNRGKCFQEYGQ
jgi:hypothetical protein